MSKISGDMVSLFKKAHDDPVFFVENVIGMTKLWSKQREIARSVLNHTRTAVRSCNGIGKTFSTANIVAWFLTTRPNSIVISTAPTARQVRELLWQEINNIHRGSKYPLGGKILQTSWTLGAKWFALGLSTDEPNRFQGFHAENILGVIDEAAGVDAPIWEAMDAILTSNGARLLVIGNPTEPSGRFYDAFSSPLYNKIHVSAFDTPNFTENDITPDDIRSGEWEHKVKNIVYPSLITPKWVAERYIEWGEESPAYQARVLGEFPSIGSDTMIPLSWVLAARDRDVEPNIGDICVIGVDVARFGDDESVVAVRRGNVITRIETFNHVDTTVLARAVNKIYEAESADFAVVDSVGIGAGVADQLRHMGKKAIDFDAQRRAWEADKFVNLRTEAWFRLRERFRLNKIKIIDDEVLIGQLTSPKYDFDGSGRYRLEKKEKMKDRGLKSPDRADAVVMAFAFESELESTVHPDFKVDTPAPDSVQSIIQKLTMGQEEEIKWITMDF